MQRKADVEFARRRVQQARQQWNIAQDYLRYVESRPHDSSQMNEFRAIAQIRFREFEIAAMQYKRLTNKATPTSCFDLPELPLIKYHITQSLIW